MVTACQRQGCSGKIDDGFCSDCGLAPAGAPRVATAHAAPRTSPTRPSGDARTHAGRDAAGLGAGLVSLPPLPSLDPLARVLADPEVPDGKRVCCSCQKKVTLHSGFCPHCGVAYSFELQIVPAVPESSGDERVDVLVTEAGVRETFARAPDAPWRVRP